MVSESSEQAKAARQFYQDSKQAGLYLKQRFSGCRAGTDRRDRRALSRALRFLSAKGKALDCPCGAGRISPVLESEGLEVFGVDISMEMLRCARGERPDMQCVQGDVLALPFDASTFTTVVSMRFLYHLGMEQERVCAFREMARVSQRYAIASFFDSMSLQGIRRKLKEIVGDRQASRVSLSRARFAREASLGGWNVLRYFPTRGRVSQHTLAVLEKSLPGDAGHVSHAQVASQVVHSGSPDEHAEERSAVSMDRMVVTAGWLERLTEEGLTDVKRVLSLNRGDVVCRSRTTRTVKVPPLSGSGLALFVKVYCFPTARDLFRGMFRGTLFAKTRPRREWEVLTRMAAEGLPGVQPVAWGVKRDRLFVRAAFLITLEAGRSSISAADLLMRWSKNAVPFEMRRRFVRTLSRAIRDIHQAGFSHGDCHLRNILVQDLDGQFAFRFIDSCKGSFGHPSRYCAAVDLAALDAGASLLVSRTERLRFFLEYRNSRTLDSADRRFLRLIRKRAKNLADRENTTHRSRPRARNQQSGASFLTEQGT